MKWIDNNLIDNKNKYLVGYNKGGDCDDWAEINVLDSNGKNITNNNLSDWEFTEFPDLDARHDYCEDEIKIVNKKLGIVGKVVLTCSNNGYYSANYWTEKLKNDE